jgi:FkbM family methyltransferase
MSLRSLVKREILRSGQAALLERALNRIGAGRTAAKVGRARSEAIVEVTLPEAAGTPRHVRMHRIGDRDQVARALAADGWVGFERPLPSAVAAFSRRWPGTFLDVGANTGFYALIAVAAADHTTAVAFEPVPEIVELLRANLSLNRSARRVVVDEVAIGDASGTASLHLPPPQPDGTIETSASLEPDFKEQIDRFFDVRTSTLDDAWEQHGRPDVVMVKIDVEGSEARVLAGARQLIEACRPIISVEVLQRVDPGPIEAARAAIGYVVVTLAPEEATIGRPVVAVDPVAPNQLLVPPERLADVTKDLRGIQGLTVTVLS